jgi:hypothetical protein
MNLFFRYYARKSKRPRLQLGVEALDDRILLSSGASMLGHIPATHGLAKNLQPVLAGQPLRASLDSKLGLAANAGATLGLLGPDMNAASADLPLDDSKAASLSDGVFGQAERAMTGLLDSLRAAGASSQDLNHLFGRTDSDTSSPLYQSVFNRTDDTADWMGQLPFMSVTQGSNSIQVGAARPADPRVADEGDTGDGGGTKDAVATKQSLPDKNGDVHIDYDNGTHVVVHNDGSVDFNYKDGSSDYVGPGSTPACIIHQNPDGTYDTQTRDGQLITGSTKTGSFGVWERVERPAMSGSQNVGTVSGWIGHIYDAQGNPLGDKVIIDLVDPHTGNKQMPNPEADGSKDGAPVPPTGPAGAELRNEYQHQLTGADIAKLAQRTVAGMQSKVNPNPNAPEPGAEGEVHSQLEGLGPHGGDPIGDEPVTHANVHSGGNPIIVFGIGGPGPKVH